MQMLRDFDNGQTIYVRESAITKIAAHPTNSAVDVILAGGNHFRVAVPGGVSTALYAGWLAQGVMGAGWSDLHKGAELERERNETGPKAAPAPRASWLARLTMKP